MFVFRPLFPGQSFPHNAACFLAFLGRSPAAGYRPLRWAGLVAMLLFLRTGPLKCPRLTILPSVPKRQFMVAMIKVEREIYPTLAEPPLLAKLSRSVEGRFPFMVSP